MTATTSRHLSFSQVRQYRECSEQYRLERIERVPQRPSTPAVAGTAFHTGSELVDEMFDRLDRDSLIAAGTEATLEAFKAERVKLEEQDWPADSWRRYGRPTGEKPKGEDYDWFASSGLPNAVVAYVDWRIENDDFEIAEIPDFGPAIEVPFNYYIGDQLVRGYIDRVLTSKSQGGFYPFDLKSGSKPKTDEQLGLYGRALSASSLGWDIHYGYFLYGLKTGKASLTRALKIDHWTDAKLERVYGPATIAIQQNLFIPSPGESCRHCSVTDHCQFFQSVV